MGTWLVTVLLLASPKVSFYESFWETNSCGKFGKLM